MMTVFHAGASRILQQRTGSKYRQRFDACNNSESVERSEHHSASVVRRQKLGWLLPKAEVTLTPLGDLLSFLTG